MAFKAKTAIGLEVTCYKVKLVEIVSSAQGIKITNFAVFDYPSDIENGSPFNTYRDKSKFAEQIKDAFGKAALNTKEIYGVISSPLAEHRIILLPPMTEKEMDAVTKREASKEGETAPLDVSSAFDVVGRIDTGGIKKTAVLIVTAPFELVKEQMRTMEYMGICLRGLTVVPLALYHALLQGKLCSEGGTTAFIYVGIKSACIIMVCNNSLLFSREFSFTSGGEVTEANYTDRLIVDVKRSFLYFKQRYRGKEVGKGILSGDMQGAKTLASLSGMDLRNIAGLLAKELDIEVEVFGVPACTEQSERNGLEVSLPQEKMPEFQSLLPSLTIPIGLAIAGLRQSRVNLLLQEGIRGNGLWRTAIPLLSPFSKGGVRGIASGILLLMLCGSYLWLSITNFFTHRTKLVTLKTLESLRPGLENINKLEWERSEHAARLLLIEGVNAPSPPEADWSELLREISWLVPDDIVFNTWEAKQEKGQRQLITIKCKCRTRGLFNKFLSNLQNSSSLSVLSSHSGVHESQVGSRGGSSGHPYRFVIECEKRQ